VFDGALITDGTDVHAVSHPGRARPARLVTALLELQPECVIAGCHVDRHLEIDHNVPVNRGGRTELPNLNRLCHHHHDLKTRGDLRLVGEGLHQRLVRADRAPPGREAA
jgi:5-methylcytosine-specific restriction endonuclease McrA